MTPEQEAKFWRLKYFELLGHSNSIIAMLGRDQLIEARAAALAAQQAAQAQEGAT